MIKFEIAVAEVDGRLMEVIAQSERTLDVQLDSHWNVMIDMLKRDWEQKLYSWYEVTKGLPYFPSNVTSVVGSYGLHGSAVNVTATFDDGCKLEAMIVVQEVK